MASNLKFSPSAGWDQVWKWLSQHANSFVAIAGVFFLLPTLLFAFFGPEAMAGAMLNLDAIDPNDPAAILNAYMQVFSVIAPFVLIMVLVQMVGQLAILAIAAGRGAATVGDAIKTGFSRLGYLVLAQIVYSLALGIVFGLAGLVVVASAAVSTAIAILLAIALLVAFIYVAIRLTLMPAILVVEDVRWPIPLLQRSWDLTGGNVGSIFLFFLIIGIVYFIISIVVAAIFGIVFGMAGESGVAIVQVIQGIVSAVGTAIFALLPLAVLRQLAPFDNTEQVFS